MFISTPCRITCRFRLRGLLVGESQGLAALLHLPVIFFFILRVRVKERASRAKVRSCVDADRFVSALVGEGHGF